VFPSGSILCRFDAANSGNAFPLYSLVRLLNVPERRTDETRVSGIIGTHNIFAKSSRGCYAPFDETKSLLLSAYDIVSGNRRLGQDDQRINNATSVLRRLNVRSAKSPCESLLFMEIGSIPSRTRGKARGYAPKRLCECYENSYNRFRVNT